MKRIIRDRKLSAEEIDRYNQIREQSDADLPDLIIQYYSSQEIEKSEDDY